MASGRGPDDGLARVHLPSLEGGRTVPLFDGSEPRTVRLALEAGEAVGRHDHPGRTVTVTVLAGELSVTVGEARHRLEAGDVIRFDGDRAVALAAETDCEALVVLAVA